MSTTPTQPARKVEWLVWFGLALIVLTLLLLVLVAAVKMRANLGKPLPVLGQVMEFTLTNQNGKAISLADLSGHAWVADIIFTRCAGPCPKMTRQLKEIQDALPAGSTTRLVSLTTDPDFDTPAVLKAYADRFGANPDRWSFLTGTKKQIEALAIDSLKLTAIEKKASDRENASDLFIHSTVFVVVDKQGRLRGVYETTGDDVDPKRAQAAILAAMHRLEREQ